MYVGVLPVDPAATVPPPGAASAQNAAPVAPRVERADVEIALDETGNCHLALNQCHLKRRLHLLLPMIRTWKYDQQGQRCQQRMLLRSAECKHVDSIVHSFNRILERGLGEVQAKYQIALLDLVESYDKRVHGKRFPISLLSNNYNIDDFKVTIFEFRGLKIKSARGATRDVRRFLGCFSFPDESGDDLPNMTRVDFQSAIGAKVGVVRSVAGQRQLFVVSQIIPEALNSIPGE